MEGDNGSPKEASGPIQIGTRTPWGKVAAVGRYRDGDRWYMMDRRGSTSLVPGEMLEMALKASAAKPAEGTEAEQSPGNTHATSPREQERKTP